VRLCFRGFGGACAGGREGAAIFLLDAASMDAATMDAATISLGSGSRGPLSRLCVTRRASLAALRLGQLPRRWVVSVSHTFLLFAATTDATTSQLHLCDTG